MTKVKCWLSLGMQAEP